MRNKFKLLSGVVIGVAFLFSCTDDYFEFDKIVLDELRPEFAVPLVNSSLSLEDILMNEDTAGVISTGTEGVLEILYEGNVISKLGGSKIPMPDILETQNINNIPSPPPGIPILIPFGDTIVYSPQSGIEIDSLLLKSGQLALSFTSTVRHFVDIDVTFPSFKKADGTVFEKTFAIPPYDGINPSVRANVGDLVGYNIDMSLNGTNVNSIPYYLTATVTNNPGSPPGSTGNLQMTANFRQLEFKDFYGYIGQDPLELAEDTILIALFKNFKNGSFYLADPVLDIGISNSYGLPLNLTFNYLNAVTTVGNQSTMAIDLGANNPISLLYPVGPGVEFTNVRLDKNTSNIPQVISALVKQIAFDADGNPNPTGDKSIRNYISDSSAIGLDVSLKMPLVGYASGFTMNDTIDFEIENAKELEQVILRTRIANGFPIEGKLQMFFVDENYIPLDSLFLAGQRVLIPKAPVNSDGIATQTANETIDIQITENRLKNLANSKFAILKAELETTNGGGPIPDTVKFIPSYKLDVALGVKARILID
jgi:hypothetical protein